jgi:hypothetical protein
MIGGTGPGGFWSRLFGQPGVASIRYRQQACLVLNAAFEGAHLIEDFPKERQVTGIAALREITGGEAARAKTTLGFSGALAKLAKEADRAE